MAITKAASLADPLVQRFEDDIKTGAMPVGARMPSENQLSATAGVSRTVVREAFARLAAKGLVVVRQGAGAFVSETARYGAFQITREELTEVEEVIKLLELRMGLESEMAALAATRRTPQQLTAIERCFEHMAEISDPEASAEADARFHRSVAVATGNEYYTRFMDFMGVRMVPSRMLYLRDPSPDVHEAYAEEIGADHLEIFAAIAASDPDRARKAAYRHLECSVRRHRNLRNRHS